ncbi:hypothetical protein [Maridesulfovibrio frigidus]|uniref:hypothetical protein n=1 Tax=Maridesulfovibrio frigidus TaxID=340956 RepID=UPI0004E0EC5C|nr:hypothetical protein [Maridesulfovibrio frigidus]
MTFFKVKSYFLFYGFLIWLIVFFIFATYGYYWGYLVIAGSVAVSVYMVRFEYLLNSVKEDRIVINYAHIAIHILFKEIKDVKFLDMGKISLLGDIDQFSIRTKKNKYYEVFFSVSSGDFEKIQEGVAKAQLQMGASNTPE